MQVTNLRKKGVKITAEQAESLARLIVTTMAKKGFDTDYARVTTGGFCLAIGGFSCFRINTAFLGYNAREPWHGRFGPRSLAGWNRTSVPTWEQRVEFNNLLNRMLDKANVTCRVKSGPFIVRDVTNGAKSERDWRAECPDYTAQNVGCIFELTGEMQAEADEKRRAHRRRQSQIRRERAQGKMVRVWIMYGESRRDEQVLTETEYKEWTLQLSTGDFHMHKARRLYKSDSHLSAVVAIGGAK